MTRRELLAPAGLFVVALAAAAAVIWQAERIWQHGQRETATQVAAGAAFAVEQQVTRSFAATYSLAALVHHDAGIENFERVAAEVLPIFGAVSSLQLAPGAVVRHIYPLTGNEAALGHDLLNDPDRRFEARAALATRRLALAGPFELKQGGFGLVGRLPVFLPEPTGERFWGFVSAIVMVPDLLEAAHLKRVEDAGYRYRLTRHRPATKDWVCFAGCDGDLRDPVEFEVEVPNGAWTLSVAPTRGWPPPPWRTLAWIVSLATAAALAVLTALVARQPALLRRQVASRTEELNRANAALADEMRRLRVAEEAARAAEEQLRQAQKMEAIGQLAGGIAHDFNNLLTGILGWASVLLEEAPEGSSAREAAQTIDAAARRASELTKQLLGFARRRELQAVPFEAHRVLEEVCALIARTLDARIRVTRSLRAARSVVLGDAGQLQQALLNLAVNARDAMPDGGELRIETADVVRDAAWSSRHPGSTPGPHLAVTVADTGHGIPPELVERIFEPFYTTKGPGQGTGLGLAMVYGIARAHGGAIEVESVTGQGSRFTLSLPLAAPGVEPHAPAPRTGASPPRAGRILVVDDDPVPRAATAAMLASAGYDPVEKASADEALRWLETHPGEARAALLDVAMPGTDGVACLDALRRLDPGLPAIFVSGYAQDGRAEKIAARGEALFLAKPFDREQLAAAIETALPVEITSRPPTCR